MIGAILLGVLTYDANLLRARAAGEGAGVKALVVVENTRRWPLRLAGVEVVSARDYLSGGDWDERRGLRVFNLCRTYGYQTLGYYVSLLAAARGHRPLPSVETLQDLRLSPVVRHASRSELEELIQRSLAPPQARPLRA